MVGAEDTTAPYSFTWDSKTVANGTNTISVLARDGANNTTVSNLINIFVDNTTSTSGPTIEDLRLIATDLIAQVNTTLTSKGKFVGTCPVMIVNSESTVEELQIQINDLLAVIADLQAGGVAVGDCPVSDIVTPPTENNLITNGNFETAGAAGNPAGWNRGGWGNNTASFIYPATGITGSGATVAMTSYNNGDAKWYFNDITVAPGEQLSFTYSYKSTTNTNLTVRYTKDDGSFTYIGLGLVPTSADWKTDTKTLVVPVNVKSVTVMLILNSVGELTIDDFTLYSGNHFTFSRGKVSFSFDDGWVEHYQVARPVLNAANIDGTFYIITNEMLRAQNNQELVQNSELETVGTEVENPANWSRGGWGNNNRTYTYPVTGASGNGIEVSIANYVDGDAKWYFEPVVVTSGMQYVISDKYNSTINSDVLASYTLDDGSTSYELLETLPATGGNWQTFSKTVTIPNNATKITLFHLISGNGSLTIDDVSIKGKQLYANTSQIQALQADGNEIGVHTKSHPMLTNLSLSEKTDEVAGARQVLLDNGINPVTGIAYPFGDYDASVKQAVSNAGLTLGRSVDRGFNDSTADPLALKIQQVDRNTSLTEMQSWIDHAATTKTWLILMFHQIGNDTTDELGVTRSDFESLVNYSVNANVDNITVAQGAGLLGL